MAGLYFEEFQTGQVFQHAIRRTVTEADNVFFSALTHNPAPLHLDEEYCRTQTEFGRRIVNSAFTLGLMVGISVGDTTLGTTVANLGWMRFVSPSRYFTVIRCAANRKSWRFARVGRDPPTASWCFGIGLSIRKACWWRVANVRRSCSGSRGHDRAFAVVRTRR